MKSTRIALGGVIARWLAACCLAWMVAGCATSGRVDWPSRIGNYTYDESVKEYGPPLRKETTTDGTQVVEWLLQKGQVYSTPAAGFGMGYWGRWGWGGTVNGNSTPDLYRQRQFGPDGRLRTWKRLHK